MCMRFVAFYNKNMFFLLLEPVIRSGLLVMSVFLLQIVIAPNTIHRYIHAASRNKALTVFFDRILLFHHFDFYVAFTRDIFMSSLLRCRFHLFSLLYFWICSPFAYLYTQFIHFLLSKLLRI